MYPHRLLLLNIICTLGFSRIALATELFTCEIPSNFTVDATNDEIANFYGSQLTFRLNQNALVPIIEKYSNTIHILAIEDAEMTFEGEQRNSNKSVCILPLAYCRLVDSFTTELERISLTRVGRIFGIAWAEWPERRKNLLLSSTNPTISDCYLTVSLSGMERPNIGKAIFEVLQPFVLACLKLSICPKIGQNLIRSDLEKMELGGLPASMELFVNQLVDVALNGAVAKVEDLITVPKINQVFHPDSGILKEAGFFKAVHGTFRGTSKIRRVVDAVISREGMKFMASGGFELKIADFKYDHYWMKYGHFFRANGMMSGTVDGVSLEAGVSVDYNLKPCVLSVEYLNVTKFGRMTIEYKDRRPPTSAAEALNNWITGKWRDEIIGTIEMEWRDEFIRAIEREWRTKMTHGISPLIDCERFRP